MSKVATIAENATAKPFANGLNTKVLNGLRRLIIDFANEKGILLQSEFGTPEKFKEFIVALAFKILTDNGMSVKNAMDFLMGDGTYDQIANEVWNAAQAK